MSKIRCPLLAADIARPGSRNAGLGCVASREPASDGLPHAKGIDLGRLTAGGTCQPRAEMLWSFSQPAVGVIGAQAGWPDGRRCIESPPRRRACEGSTPRAGTPSPNVIGSAAATHGDLGGAGCSHGDDAGGAAGAGRPSRGGEH